MLGLSAAQLLMLGSKTGAQKIEIKVLYKIKAFCSSILPSLELYTYSSTRNLLSSSLGSFLLLCCIRKKNFCVHLLVKFNWIFDNTSNISIEISFHREDFK